MAMVVSNDSLAPTRLDPSTVFTPSNYPDNKSVIGAFRRAVQMTLEDSSERAALFGALKKFHASMVVEELMDNLKAILDNPEKRILYKYISPLIPHRLRGEYKTLVPHIPSFEKKIVRLKQQGNHSYGFSVRGGKEFGCGIFVTNVLKSSRAAQSGLMPGDQIIRVNGLIVSESTHEEFINLVKLKRTLTLNVKVVGLIPEKKEGSNNVTWKSVGEKRGWQNSRHIGIHGPIQSTRRIHVTLQGNEPLGASIKTSSAIDGGVLIVDVMPNSAADNAGLKRGDEILEVNGVNLIGRTMNEGSKLLRSSNTLMLTIRVEESSKKNRLRHSLESVPMSEVEFGPNDFDIDVETLSPKGRRKQYSEETGFVLQSRQPPSQQKGPSPARKISNTTRFSIIDSEVEQSRDPPTMAFPAAFGYGPALAMPTILGMAQRMPPGNGLSDFDEPVFFQEATTPVKKEPFPRSSVSPASPPPEIPLIGRATVEGTNEASHDLSMYQFPNDDEETDAPKKLTRQVSALKKAENKGQKRVKKPSFSEDVQIIPRQGFIPESSSKDTLNQSTGLVIHPSNLSFSQEILQGRQVQFHTIPKDGPLRLAIRGGIDTPLGPQIIISRIIEGGSAHSYGKLNVGDQVLVCDGVSLIDVTHDEAGQAFKQAMDLDSPSIDLVVAVNPDAKSAVQGGTDTRI